MADGDLGSPVRLPARVRWPSSESAISPTWFMKSVTGTTNHSRRQRHSNGEGENGWRTRCRQSDLTPFRARGGKLILYHGWNDPAIPALNTVNYYDEVLAKMGRRRMQIRFVRLYMVPGMQHCGGGPGPKNSGSSEHRRTTIRSITRTSHSRTGWRRGPRLGAIIASQDHAGDTRRAVRR